MYLALYRKYRPEVFEDLIGQEHITKTLVNQIAMGQVGHAYLFCGSRGTGKTTAAKVFSRAINCQSPKSGSPCGKCAACKALSDPSNMDIIEIDAASNNRVDEVRDIREKAKYPPVSGKYKVYIIDEVHMLTESAFNALLKTLEEPPKHAVFILATTEAHKLPSTILSRVLRFDFKLLARTDIEKLLKKVFKSAGITCDEAALSAIAVAGEGSVRDALSVADMVAAYSNNNITYNAVLEVLGSGDKNTIIDISRAILGGNVAGFVDLVNVYNSAGRNLQALVKDLTAHFYQLIMIKTLPEANKTLLLPKEVFVEMQKDCAADAALLNECMQTFNKAGLELKFAPDPLLCLTAAGLGIMLGGDKKKRVIDNSPLERGVGKADGVCLNKVSAPPLAATTPSASLCSHPPLREQRGIGLAEANGDARKIWGQVLQELDKKQCMLLYPICGKISNVYINGNNFVVAAGSAAEQKLLKKEQNYNDLVAAFAGIGYNYNIVIEVGLNIKTQTKNTEDILKEKLGDILKIKE
ncbi:MAG: DNA polymerase III subunit gamma/tau [Firmicutes bacterium]|nr:DNA polymerase III subunit gamma/tau [Bacillota bacterium]